MSREDVLFATIEAGGGHLATARAMEAAVRSIRPGLRLRVSDYMLELGLFRQDRQHKRLWRSMLRRPWLIRSGQTVLDALPAATRAWHRISLREFAVRAAADLNGAGTSLVVANHGWLATGLTLARQLYGLESRVLVFATEPLDASALWSVPAAEHVIAPSAAARADLIRLGVPAASVSTVGYPVGPDFLQPAPARRQADPLRVLVSLGGEGIGGDPVRMLRLLSGRGWQATVLCGRNEALLRRLELAFKADPLVTQLGFTDRVAELTRSADAVVGKAGPASVLEALALGRPYAATGYAGLNELRLIRFLSRRGLGGPVRAAAGLPGFLERFTASLSAREAVAERCAQLDFPGMTDRLGRAIVALLETGTVPADLKDRGLDSSPVTAQTR